MAKAVTLYRDLTNQTYGHHTEKNEKIEKNEKNEKGEKGEKNKEKENEKDKNKLVTITSPGESKSTAYQSTAALKRSAAIIAATMTDAKHKSLWKIPELLISFMSNLPLNLSGISPNNKSWTLRKTFQLLNLKCVDDIQDMDMGSGVQVQI